MSIEHVLKTIGTTFINFSKNGFTYGLQGNMLLRNLEAHWFLHCVTMSPYNVFITTTDRIKHTLQILDNMNINEIPYGLAIIKDSKTSWNQLIWPPKCKVTSHKIAKTITFAHNSQSKDLFYKKQRERKMWWRKLTQNPSRFLLTESRKLKNREIIDIEVLFPFGNIIVETIIYQCDVHKLFVKTTNSKYDIDDVHMIEHVASLDWGCLALLSDSYEDGKSNQILLHPKISPYKVAFCIEKESNETDSDTEKLSRFIIYLNNILRTKGFETILVNTKEVIEMCLVPFVVTVAQTSLKNGIIHITNRSTTLAEAIHFTDLVKYIALRCSHSV
uniref:DNA polymerase subunit gamma-2, mitochondrial n=1 Tax=Vespula vulgaris TaxID=7454 RepID=UPI00223BAE66|nr:DNA polymerase subunit gamma-2, mitochondrial [Vespula vulgaris]